MTKRWNTSILSKGRFQLLLVDNGLGLPEVDLRACEVVVQGHVELPVVLREAEESRLLARLGQDGELPRLLALGGLQAMLESVKRILLLGLNQLLMALLDKVVS